MSEREGLPTMSTPTTAAALIDALPANLVSYGKQVEREALAGFILNELARSGWMLIHRDEARASRETGLDVERLREALLHLVAMVEENGPEYANSDAMLDAREALTPEDPR